MNPAFIPNFTKIQKVRQTQDMLSFCQRQNIGMSQQEDKFYKVKEQKRNHRLWAGGLNRHFPKEKERRTGDLPAIASEMVSEGKN